MYFFILYKCIFALIKNVSFFISVFLFTCSFLKFLYEQFCTIIRTLIRKKTCIYTKKNAFCINAKMHLYEMDSFRIVAKKCENCIYTKKIPFFRRAKMHLYEMHLYETPLQSIYTKRLYVFLYEIPHFV